jgi:Holliday junction resolvasome RuvABC endonuclease subunit
MFNIENNLEELSGIKKLKKANALINQGNKLNQISYIEFKQKSVNKAYLGSHHFEKTEMDFKICTKVF